jgi:glycosyltransferase involved in cell wall biosynthesis
MKIAVYGISKDEEQFVKRFCDSCKEADLVVIADTGSTDNTVALLRECGAVVHQIHVSPFRFDVARNAALALVPADVDVCIALDLDEVLQPGFRAEIERLWKSHTTLMTYRYGEGPRFVYDHCRIHARSGFYWKCPCQEVLVPDRVERFEVSTEFVLVRHFPDPTKKVEYQRDLFELGSKENPTCPRCLFNHAGALIIDDRYQEAIDTLKNYLSSPEKKAREEECAATQLLGRCHEALGRSAEALRWFRRATVEFPEIRDPWLSLAQHTSKKKLWGECLVAATSALAISKRLYSRYSNPGAWGKAPYDLGSLAAWNLGLLPLAYELCSKAVEFDPKNPRLLENLEAIGSALSNPPREERAAGGGPVQLSWTGGHGKVPPVSDEPQAKTKVIKFGSETVCVTVVCHNRWEYTKQTLESFRRSAAIDKTPYVLYLVDNGSTDGTLSFLEQFRLDNPAMPIRIIRLDTPTSSVAAAFNRGWWEGRECGYFVKLDNDITTEVGFLGRMKRMLDAEAGFGLIGIPPIEAPSSPYCDPATLGQTVYGKPHRSYRKDLLWGACIMTRADVLNRVGVLCEQMPRHEDAEFSARLVDFGYTIGYLPNGERCVQTEKGGSENNKELRHQKYLQGLEAYRKIIGQQIVQGSCWAGSTEDPPGEGCL